MRIGLVCPYPWDVPGGVMAHVRDLAGALHRLGHRVSVLAPVDDDEGPLPPYLVPAGRTVPVRYNGSVARLVFGPLSAARTRRWLREGDFDVLHLHSPETLSLSLLALLTARGPIVATFHSANPRSRMLAAFSPALAPQLEKIQGCIAVSPAARRTIVEHLGWDAVVIPNGVDVAAFAGAAPLPGHPPGSGSVGFLGRTDEPRKGLANLVAAFPAVLARHPAARLLVAGPGHPDDMLAGLPRAARGRVVTLGRLSEADKASFYRSLDVYVAPNTGAESFGIVLLEAMASGAPIVASDLESFRPVVGDGRAAVLVPPQRPDRLAAAVVDLLVDPVRRAELAAAGRRIVTGYDWSAVAAAVVGVYETVVGPPLELDDLVVAGPVAGTPEPTPQPAPEPVAALRTGRERPGRAAAAGSLRTWASSLASSRPWRSPPPT